MVARRTNVVGALLLGGLLASPAFADTYTVRNFFDSGPNSLREAISLANAHVGTDTIVFDFSGQGFPPPPLTCNLATPLPTITENLTIIGPGADVLTLTRLPGAAEFSLLNVSGNVQLRVEALTLLRGISATGGAIRFSGAGSLSVRSCVMNQCTADGAGGAIWFSGAGAASVEIIDTSILEATSEDSGGAIAIDRQGGTYTLNVVRSTFSRSAVKTSAALKFGGAISIAGTGGPGTVTLDSSTFIGNTVPSSGFGGTIHFAANGGALNATNCTFTSGTAGDGSVIVASDATITMLNCTLYANAAIAASTGTTILANGSSTVTATNCILSGNSSGSSLRDLAPGQALSGRNNLIGVGGTLATGINANIVGVTDPRLAPINTIGGTTATFALKPDSPALDAGSNADAPGVDQRGQPRSADGDNNGTLVCDIGAFETQKFVVTTTDDAGAGSLRQALLNNNLAGGGFVRFAIGGTGSSKKIAPTTALPTISRPVYLDAWSQGGPAFSGSPMIELDGIGMASASGLDIQAPDSIVRGFAINNFKGTTGTQGIGLIIRSGTGNRNWVYGCHLGLGLDGSTAKGNEQAGIAIFVNANTNLIGTNGDGAGDAMEANIIGSTGTGGVRSGVYVQSNSNSIAGNHIGIDKTGTSARPNSSHGVFLDTGAANNRVGASFGHANPIGERNIISGNSSVGVYVRTGSGAGNSVLGNYIGTNINGTTAVPNGMGIYVDGSITTAIGGGEVGSGNVVSGNLGDGIVIGGTGSVGCVVQGNLVGVMADGNGQLGNGGNGMLLFGGASFTRIGVLGDLTQTDAGRRNVFSGNGLRGVVIQDPQSMGSELKGNLIGTNASGTASVPNLYAGVRISDSPGTLIGGVGVFGNVISGNSAGTVGNGIELYGAQTRGTIIQNNAIGLSLDRQSTLGNRGAGILMWGGVTNSYVGGTEPGEGNAISGNSTGIMILTDTSLGNAILGNSIFGNSALGIDLLGNGVTSNGAANVLRVGPNNLQNYPVISSVSSAGVVSATLTARAARAYRVEFFSSPSADATGYGEGRTLLGSVLAVTDAAGSTGPLTFSFTPTASEPYVTATATDLGTAMSGFSAIGPGRATSTSEFSLARAFNVPPVASAKSVSGVEDTDQVIVLDGTDANPLDTVTASITALPTRGTLLQFGTLSPITAVPTNVTDAQRRVVYRPPANQFGTGFATVIFRLSDGTESSAAAVVTIGVDPAADTPSITGASTIENITTTSGLVITRNSADGPEVTHYKIVAATGGTVLLGDGTTTVSIGQFITSAQGAAGLRFRPDNNFVGNGTVSVRASVSAVDAGLGGAAAVGSIAVGPSARTPSVTSATTLEDTMSTSGLVISRGAGNGAEVTHFKITSLGTGALRLADGTTGVSVGQFITAAQGAAGLRFVPNADDNGTVSVGVAASLSSSDAGISNAPATASVTVTPVNDAPSFNASNPPTVHLASGMQSIPGWATFSPGPANESSQTVQAYLVSNISNPSLFSTAPSVDTSGRLTFTPATGASGDSTFTVRVRDSGGTSNGGVDTSGPQTFTISVVSANLPPDFTAANPPAVLEGSGAHTLSGWVTSFTPGPPHESSQSVLEYLVDNVSNPSMFVVAPSVSNSGRLAYTLANTGAGTSTFRVRVRDNGGTTAGGVDTSNPQTFTIVARPAAACRNKTIDCKTACVARTVTLSDINGTSTSAGPGATQTVTTSLPLTTVFPLGDSSVVVTVRYSDGLESSCTAKVTVLGDDCNSNQIPDACDISAGTSADCNMNGVPDECECVWNNGWVEAVDAPNANGQLSHLGGGVPLGQRVADDFYLRPGAMYHLLGFSGQMITSSLSAVRKARLEIYADCDGMPSGLPIRTFLSSTVLSTVPAASGFDLVTYDFNLCTANVYLNGGNSYWVSLTGVTDGQGNDTSYWATTTAASNPTGVMGSGGKKGDGLPGAMWPNFLFGPWEQVDDCCLGCVNFAFKIRGEECPLVWDNGWVDGPGGAGGTPSGSNRTAYPSPRAADNFVVKPCDDAVVCMIETAIFTNCNPSAAFVEIYDNNCRKPGQTPIFSGSPTTWEALPQTITVDGVTYAGYRLRFTGLNWRLAAGKTYWLSSGAEAPSVLAARAFFGWASDCQRTCTIKISPGQELNTPGNLNTWVEGTRDFAFRVWRKGEPLVSHGTTDSGSGATNSCTIDINHDGAATMQDVFDFMSAWFAGCP